MVNSTSTIFIVEFISNTLIKTQVSQTVFVGCVVAGLALLIAVILVPLLGSLSQVFQFIQEYIGIVTPDILSIFLLGLF